MIKNINISKPIIENGEINAVIDVLKSGKLTQGEKVLHLEKEFIKLFGSKYAVAVTNGTSALHVALHAIGIMPGDEVITTPFTFVATANSILMAGAKPIFIDIDENTFNIDPLKIEKAITNKTRAILVVNIYGQPANYDHISRIAKRHNLLLVEDAAQSIGATYKKQVSGNLADISCFSLYATKNIMCGEGGMITTNCKEYSENARYFRQHGQDENDRYKYVGLGYNYRMTDIHAVIAIEQLKRLKIIIEKRRKIAKFYEKKLSNIQGLILPYISPDVGHVFHQYTLRITNNFAVSRKIFINYLKKNNIQANIYYPIPLFKFPHLRDHHLHDSDFPITNCVVNEVVSIPVHPLLSSTEIEFIAETIINCSKL
jgi:dTDP-4-amino-4,6-dideoxygalactose transaminase